MQKNPFSLSFGKEPVSLINRNVQSYEIIDTFEDENPAYQVCMITGVRGSGKTVMLTEINKTFRAEEDWIAMAKTNGTKVEAIRKTIKKASNSFSVYRNRLKKKGLIISQEYGHLEFALPRFKEFVLCR